MALVRGPRIVRNGLVLHLDAAQKTSYSGSGTTWNDLSGNKYNGTLINSPTFSTEVGGCFTFDGINQYIDFGDVLDMTTNDISGFAWTNLITAKNFTAIIDKLSSAGNYRLHVNLNRTVQFGIRNSAGTFEGYSAGSMPLNVGTWYYLGFTHNITTKLSNIYINGKSITSYTHTIDRGNTNASLTIGYATNNNEYANIKQASISLYNKELSASEILQNYNTTKGRFNL